MAVPKRKLSSARKSFSKCTQCGELKVPHRVCPNCGYYKGKEVVKIAD